MGTVTKPGFYDGVFKKAGQHASDEAIKAASAEADGPDINKMSKDELLAEAERRGVGVSASATKAEILKALSDA